MDQSARIRGVLTRASVAIVALALLVPASATRAAAQNVGPRDTVALTLEDAVQRALLRGTAMRIARSQVLDAEGSIHEAFSSALPQVTGSLVYTRQFASIYSGAAEDTSAIAKLFKNSPFGAPNLWTFQLQATQTLWSGGRVGAALAGARTLREAAAAREDQTAADVILGVKIAYYNALAATRLSEIAQTTLAQARDHERQVRLFRQQGTRADYDLLRAQVDAANQEPGALAARNASEFALRELRRQLDLDVDQPLALGTPLLPVDATIPVVDFASLPDAESPALRAAEATIGVQRAALRIAAADRWPSLSVVTTYSEQAFPQELFPSLDAFRRGWNGEVRLSVPLFLGLRTVGTLERARAGLLRAEADRDQVRAQLALDLAQAREEVERTQALLTARRGTVRLAQRALYLAGARYANGLASQVEVSDTRVSAQQAEVNEVIEVRDYLAALARLERALGRPIPTVRRPLDQLARVGESAETRP